MKAAPLLRAWLHRLRAAGVRFHMRHRWLGWDERRARCASPRRRASSVVHADAVVLALGGAQLAAAGLRRRLGAAAGASAACDVAPLRPANCGFDVAAAGASTLRSRFAGAPVKPVALRFTAPTAGASQRRASSSSPQTGVEGSLVYAASALLRDAIAAHGSADAARSTCCPTATRASSCATRWRARAARARCPPT